MQPVRAGTLGLLPLLAAAGVTPWGGATATGDTHLTGLPWARHAIDGTDASPRGADGVRALDVNGDGRADLVVPFEEGGQVRVYLQPGVEEVRGPWPFVCVGRVGSPEDALFVDLNRDGAFDVVSSCEGDQRTVFVHWAPADSASYLRADRWVTQAWPATEDERDWMYATALQMDGQHGVDLVLGSKRRGASLGWLRAPELVSELRNWRYRELRPAGWIMSIERVDLDGDGHQDLLVSDREGSHRGVTWWRNPGAQPGGPATPWREHALCAAGEEVLFVDAQDLDGDRRPEVLACVKPLRVHLARPSAAGPEHPWNTTIVEAASPRVGSAKAVRGADLDLDGRVDLVLTCEDAQAPRSGVFWMRASGDAAAPRWEARELSGPAGRKFDRMELLDLDGDGDLDVVTTEEQEALGVIWYENPTRRAAR